MRDTDRMTIPSTTVHWSNGDVEVHRVVVGSYDNTGTIFLAAYYNWQF